MSQTHYASEVKQIACNRETVYGKLSDLNTLALIRQAVENPSVRAAMSSQFDEKKADQLAQAVQGMTFDADSVSFKADPMGNVTLRIVEREEPKCIKFEGVGMPFAVNAWIQLLPTADGRESLMKLTLGAELNLFIRQMVGKKLQAAVNQVAEVLKSLPYAQM